MAYWRVAIVSMLSTAALAAPPIVNQDVVTVTRTLTRSDVNQAPSGLFELTCPEGFVPTTATPEFSYPNGTADLQKDGLADMANGGVTQEFFGTETAEFTFNRPAAGRWTSVQLHVRCFRTWASSTPMVGVTAYFTAAPGAAFVGGFSQCPAGQTAVGGSAGFPGGTGRVVEETANSALSDPFLLPPTGSFPILWDAYGKCRSPRCGLEIYSMCGTLPADLDHHKALRGAGGAAATRTKRIDAKVAVAAGAVGAVTVTCPAGMVATAPGYVAQDPTQTTLLDLAANTTGTPYAGRPDGTHEAPVGWTAKVQNTSAFANQIGATAVCVKAAAAPGTVMANYQGLWWADPPGSESGWGVNFTHQGDVVFATWFTFDADGKPLWFAAVLDKTAAGVYTGNVQTVTGPSFDAQPWDPSKVARTVVGTMTVTFTDATHATMAYTVFGIAQSKAIVPQQFATPPVSSCAWGLQLNQALAANLQDLWWAAPAESESGWGVNFTQQGDVIFLTWFTYAADGKPLWLVAVTRLQSPGVYEGDILSVTGPPFNTVPWDVNAVVRTTVGKATITVTDGAHATFKYTVNDITQTKAIIRQVFAAPGTVCE